MTVEGHCTLTPLGGEGWEGTTPFNAQMCARDWLGDIPRYRYGISSILMWLTIWRLSTAAMYIHVYDCMCLSTESQDYVTMLILYQRDQLLGRIWTKSQTMDETWWNHGMVPYSSISGNFQEIFKNQKTIGTSDCHPKNMGVCLGISNIPKNRDLFRDTARDQTQSSPNPLGPLGPQAPSGHLCPSWRTPGRDVVVGFWHDMTWPSRGHDLKLICSYQLWAI